MSDAYCRHCGTPFANDTDRFCAQCGKARANAAAPEQHAAGGKARGLTLSLLLGVLGFAALPIFLIFGVFGGGGVEGKLAVTDSPYGSFVFAPTGCQSMQPFGRAGANVHGDGPHDGGLYVTMDPLAGTRVDVEVPRSCKNADGTDCTVFAVPRDRCTRFEVTAEFNGTVINDVRQYNGHARLDCTLDDGTRVVGDVTFKGC